MRHRSSRFGALGILRALLPSMRVVRAVTYLTFAFCILGLAGARVLYADAREATLHLGRQLAQFGDLTGDADTIRLNGAAVHIATAFTAESVHDVLDRFETECTRNAGSLGKTLGDALATNEAKVATGDAKGSLGHGVVRDEQDGGGSVVCFTGNGSPGDLRAHLEAYVKTHDLSVFGDLNYAIAERAPDGRTRVRTLWTHGAINLDAMFPSKGDVPGSDSLVAPRPPSSRRVLAASADGQPFAARIYSTSTSQEGARSFYESAMPEHGFTRVPPPEGAHGAAYLRADGLLVIVAIGKADDGATVSIIEGGRSNAESMASIRAVE